MPRKKTRRKKPKESYTYVVVVVDHFEVETEMKVNGDVYNPQYAWISRDDDPLYEATNQITFSGTCSYPDERAGDLYQVSLYSDESLSRDLYATLQDAQLRDKYGTPKYRQYRGREIPVYDAPKGLAVLRKFRGESEWTAWIKVKPRMISDAFILAGQNRQLYLTLDEWKFERKRWIRSIRLRTTDPEDE